MITKLKGIVDSINENTMTLDVNGVGYLLFCSNKTLSNIPSVGEAATLYTELHVREDLMQLYGFATADERAWFKLLTSVQGVGMKVALAILSALTTDLIYQAITQQDKALMTQADGVGPKLALRILNELKDKVEKLFLSSYGSEMPATSGMIQPIASASLDEKDAISALMNLGYRQMDATRAVQKVAQEANDNLTVDELIRQGLAMLAVS